MMVFSEVHDLTLYGLQSTFFPGKCSTRVCGYKQGQESTAEKNSSVKTSVYSLSRSIAACVSSILLSCLISLLSHSQSHTVWERDCPQPSSHPAFCHLPYSEAYVTVPHLTENWRMGAWECQLFSYPITMIYEPCMHIRTHMYTCTVKEPEKKN